MIGVVQPDGIHTHGTTPLTQIPTPHCRPVGGDRAERLSTSNEMEPSSSTSPPKSASMATRNIVPSSSTTSRGDVKTTTGDWDEPVRLRSRPIDETEKPGYVPDPPSNNDAESVVGAAAAAVSSGRRCAPMWPVIEAMSQDAVAELVNSFFANAGVAQGQRMSYDQFFTLSQSDRSLLAWFEALGTVF